jgi:hypothetical protein
MRHLQIVPREDFNLYGALVGREVELHRKDQGTFFWSGRKEKDRAKWAHQKHPGWVKLARGMGGVVLAEIRTKADPDQEWQLFQAFLGFLDRNFRENLASINIQFSE